MTSPTENNTMISNTISFTSYRISNDHSINLIHCALLKLKTDCTEKQYDAAIIKRFGWTALDKYHNYMENIIIEAIDESQLEKSIG